jgi:hypothetical protein
MTVDGDRASERPPLTIDELEQWELFGGTWRTLEHGGGHAVVELCACTSEAIDRRQTSDPAVLARLLSGE